MDALQQTRGVCSTGHEKDLWFLHVSTNSEDFIDLYFSFNTKFGVLGKLCAVLKRRKHVMMCFADALHVGNSHFSKNN